MGIILLLMIIKKKYDKQRVIQWITKDISQECWLRGVRRKQSPEWGRREGRKKGRGLLYVGCQHTQGTLEWVGQKLRLNFSIPSSRKNWTDVLANPIAPQPCRVRFILLIENSRSLEGVAVAPRASGPNGIGRVPKPRLFSQEQGATS